jgi:hypothetical protein
MENQLREKLYDERFARDKERIERHEEHMKEQDAERKELRELTIEMSEMIKRHDERILDHGARLKAIETKPGKRWDMVIDKIVNAVVAACVAWLMTKGA